MKEKEEEEIFEISWLEERYPFDVEARSKELEAMALKPLEKKSVLTLVDIGAGTGSNCLYFIKQLAQNQKWLLIEEKENFKAKIIRRLKDYASFHKYDFEQKKKKISIRSLAKTVQVEIINDSFASPASFANLSKADLILANAAFENRPAAQFHQFAQLILKNKIPCLFTLNYKGVSFEPEDPFDAIFIDLYHTYLERKQHFGNAMGKNSETTILSFFEQKNWLTHSKSSNWKIEQADIKMHYYLLSFIENAIETMGLDLTMQANFQKWLQRKKDLVITRKQQLEIKHLDIYAKPSL